MRRGRLSPEAEPNVSVDPFCGETPATPRNREVASGVTRTRPILRRVWPPDAASRNARGRVAWRLGPEPSRDKAAALKFIKKAMKRHGQPKAIVTDGLRSYGAALKEIGNADRQEVGRWLNNRCENSHQPLRRRERAMPRFRRMKTPQKFASVHNHFIQERHLVSRKIDKERRAAALADWRSVMG